ncbi:MAG: sulfotransferase domain-containing protein [Nitrospirae bacterium]|nr:sulfotransferase domain-containing protein [Nitrospirota bacterium]
MMMKMLEAGGLELVVDNIRRPDEDNPKGYYEFEKVKKIKEDTSWIDGTLGKAVKMVYLLLYELPRDRNYKIIFMRRKMEEVLASQKKMLVRKGIVGGGDDDEMMGKLFKRQLDEIEEWLIGQKNIEVIYMSYTDLIENPIENAKVINRFLGGSLDMEKMAAVADKSLYRQRR